MSNLFPNAWHIARREYLQRVRSRSFFIVTLVLALVGIGLAMLPLGIRMLEGENAPPRRLPPRLVGPGGHRRGPGSGARQRGRHRWARLRGHHRRRSGSGAQVRDGQLDGLLTIARAEDGDLSYVLFTDEGLTGGTPTAIRTAVYQVSVGDRLQRRRGRRGR